MLQRQVARDSGATSVRAAATLAATLAGAHTLVDPTAFLALRPRVPELPDSLRAALPSRYDIVREVGHGAAATVYLARDLIAGQDVAIKVLRSELLASLSAERFLREIRLAGRLRHPHIVPVVDAGEAGGVLYAVLPFIRGRSLRDRLERDRQLPIAEAVRIACQVAEALTFAHDHGVVHRDVKPENILLSDDLALVADFGIARAIDDSVAERLTEVGSAIGTPAYMSPEQGAGDRDVDARSDIYSLGCVVYEMLTGEPPFVGRTAQAIIVRHIRETPLPVRALRATVPEAVERAVSVALAKVPVDRHASADAFRIALLEGGEEPSHPIPAEPSRAGSDRLNRGALVSKMCNRWQQVNDFDAFLRSNYRQRPREPQLFVVPGHEGEGHDTLVERLVATSIAHLAAEIGGSDRGTVLHKRVAWPESDDVGLRARDLIISLFRDCEPAYMGGDSSSDALAALPALAHTPVVVFQHDVRAHRWDAAATELVVWYVTQFWSSLRIVPGVRPVHRIHQRDYACSRAQVLDAQVPWPRFAAPPRRCATPAGNAERSPVPVYGVPRAQVRERRRREGLVRASMASAPRS